MKIRASTFGRNALRKQAAGLSCTSYYILESWLSKPRNSSTSWTEVVQRSRWLVLLSRGDVMAMD
jgi:hypothetical protein